jgi:hypothetical protein
MRTDNALANCEFFENSQGGDTGRRGMEHRSFVSLWFTHNLMQTGQRGLWFLNMMIRKQMKMGPRGGIEPPSREPQSLMLPVHHLGHCSSLTGLVHQLIRNFLLAYPSYPCLCVTSPHRHPMPKS